MSVNEKIIAVAAAVKHVERALACLDAADLYPWGAKLCDALDSLECLSKGLHAGSVTLPRRLSEAGFNPLR